MSSHQVQKPQPIRTISNSKGVLEPSVTSSPAMVKQSTTPNENASCDDQTNFLPAGPNPNQLPCIHATDNINPGSSSISQQHPSSNNTCSVKVTYMNASQLPTNSMNNTCVGDSTSTRPTSSNHHEQVSFEGDAHKSSGSLKSSTQLDPAVTFQENNFKHNNIIKNSPPASTTCALPYEEEQQHQHAKSSATPCNTSLFSTDNHSTATSQLSHPYNTSYHNNSNQSSLNSPFDLTTHVEYPNMQHLPTLSSSPTSIANNSQQLLTAQTPLHHHVNHSHQQILVNNYSQKQIASSTSVGPNYVSSSTTTTIRQPASSDNNSMNNHQYSNNNNRNSPNSIMDNTASSSLIVNNNNINNTNTVNGHHQLQTLDNNYSESSSGMLSSLPPPPQPIPVSANHNNNKMMMTSGESVPMSNSTNLFISHNSNNNNNMQQILTTTISSATCGGALVVAGNNNSPTCVSTSNFTHSNSNSSLEGHVKSTSSSNNNNNQTIIDGYSSTSSSGMSMKACSTITASNNDDPSLSQQNILPPERKKKRTKPPPIMNSTNGQQHHPQQIMPPFIPIQPHPSLTPISRNPPSPSHMNSIPYQSFAKIMSPYPSQTSMQISPTAASQQPHGVPVPFYTYTPFPTTPTGVMPPQQRMMNTMMNMPSPTTPIQVSSSSSQGDVLSSSSGNSDDSSNGQQQSGSNFPTSAPSSHQSYEINIQGDSCSTIIKLNVGLTLDKYHDIRMKKTIFETFIENQRTVNDGRSGISNETQKITAWRLKQVEIVKNVCFFRFKLLEEGKQENQTMELDKNGYEINGNALAKVCENGPNRLAFSLDSYGKRVSKRLHKEKLVTCPFLITLTNGAKDFVKCVCVHLCINKIEKKTVITRADFDPFLRDKSYLLALITQYASTTTKRKQTVDEDSVSSDEEEQQPPLKSGKKLPSGRAHTELRIKEGPSGMVTINCVTLRYSVAFVDPGPQHNWKVSLKGSQGEIDCQILNVSIIESESSSSYSTVSIFFELPIVADKVSVLVVKYKNVEQSANAAFYMIK